MFVMKEQRETENREPRLVFDINQVVQYQGPPCMGSLFISLITWKDNLHSGSLLHNTAAKEKGRHNVGTLPVAEQQTP